MTRFRAEFSAAARARDHSPGVPARGALGIGGCTVRWGLGA
ncbi:hypothetical protein [Paludisphaera rhizosphaerae]|nr:hypothetical protein [Paludisphaera rhizosphaerae]